MSLQSLLSHLHVTWGPSCCRGSGPRFWGSREDREEVTQVPGASCHHQNERVAILLQVFACNDDCNQMLWEEYESRGVYLTLPTKSLPGPICSHLKGLPELPVVSEQSSTFDTICDPAQVAPFPSRKVWSCHGDDEPDGALGGVVSTIRARSLRREVN